MVGFILKPQQNVGPNILEWIVARSPMTSFGDRFPMRRTHLPHAPQLRETGQKLIQVFAIRAVARFSRAQRRQRRLQSRLVVEPAQLRAAQFKLRVEGDKYYEMGSGIEETGQRVQQ